jgi:hypothetical protein
VIRAALCTDHGHAAQQGGDRCRTCRRRADVALAALTAAGYQVVHLPSPNDVHSRDGTPRWHVAAPGHRLGHLVQPWRFDGEADYQRAIGAAYLASARWLDKQAARASDLSRTTQPGSSEPEGPPQTWEEALQ